MRPKFGDSIISMTKVIISYQLFYIDLTRKTALFESWSWFKLNNLELAPGTNLKFYTSMAKRLKLKVAKVFGLQTGRGSFLNLPPPQP